MKDHEYVSLASADVSSTHSRETVLVVESEVLTRYFTSDYLRECGYKVIEASTADEALMVLQDGPLGVDVLLSAVQIPGSMDGLVLAEWVRAHHPEVGVFLASISRTSTAAAELHTVLVERRGPSAP
jgi:CheY-like chemotaxis protein